MDREYITCLHCGRQLVNRNRQTCGKLCKSVVDKARRSEARRAVQEHPPALPSYNLTDKECFRLELNLVYDTELEIYKTYRPPVWTKRIRRHVQVESVTWASKGAELDIAEIRRKDRARFGGLLDAPGLRREFDRIHNVPLTPKREIIFVSDLENAMTCIDDAADTNRRADALTIRARLMIMDHIVAQLETALAA